MDNENKEILGNDSVTPEERLQQMKDDVSAKIADAAAELEDMSTDETIDETSETSLENSFTEVTKEPKEKKSVNLSLSSLIGIVAGCVVVAALIVVLCMNAYNKNANGENLGKKAEGKVVAVVGDEKLTDADLSYYIYAEAMNQYYALNEDASDEDFSAFDWDQEVDGVKLSDTIKENAYQTALGDMVTIQKGNECLSDEDKWSDEDESQVTSTVSGYVKQFGDEGFELRARTMGISSANEYARVYKTVIKSQTIQSAMEDDITPFMPEDADLSQYTKDDAASVKHILIMTTDGSVADPSATPDPDAVDEATGLATATTVYEQAIGGADFDELMATYNKDTGEPTSGYTFKTGEMVEEFETAAFALGLDEISQPVKTTYGYHVIKRVAGLYEIQGYWMDNMTIKEKKSVLDKISVADIMNDVQAATEELENENAAEEATADAE